MVEGKAASGDGKKSPWRQGSSAPASPVGSAVTSLSLSFPPETRTKGDCEFRVLSSCGSLLSGTLEQGAAVVGGDGSILLCRLLSP